MKIQKVLATEILDSRGTPTVGATVILSDGSVGTANAPSGASTGKFEAHEKRDNDRKRYLGRGVKKAVEGIEETVAPVLENMQRVTVQNVDRMLIELDNTKNKEKLGANATLAVSLAAAKALAAHYKQPFFRYLGGTNAQKLPVPMMNILNGGAHAANNVDIQEFMIVPVGAKSFSEAVRMGSEIYHTLGGILKQRGLAVSVGDEGGFAPNLASDEEAIEVILEAVSSAGYTTDEVKIALDAAASEWTANDGYLLPKRGTKYTSAQLIAYWEKLCEKYPICYIEDPLGAVELAKENGMKIVMSHRSGETEDTSIADIAVAVNAGFIKSGAPCRSDRTAKYNRLLRIAKENEMDEMYGTGK